MNWRLFFAIATSLLDEAVILAIVLWGLPLLGVDISATWLIVILGLFSAYAILTYKVGSRALRLKPLLGLTDMVGMQGKTLETINRRGLVKIKGELWQARSESGPIKPGIEVIVTGRDGLKLTVKPTEAPIPERSIGIA